MKNVDSLKGLNTSAQGEALGTNELERANSLGRTNEWTNCNE